MMKEIGHPASHLALTLDSPVIVIPQMIDDIELSLHFTTKILPDEWGIEVLETSDHFILIQAFGKILDTISVLLRMKYTKKAYQDHG